MCVCVYVCVLMTYITTMKPHLEVIRTRVLANKFKKVCGAVRKQGIQQKWIINMQWRGTRAPPEYKSSYSLP